ncbi:hypothetical protein EJB05_34814, partial [Eragrostis curvula]
MVDDKKPVDSASDDDDTNAMLKSVLSKLDRLEAHLAFSALRDRKVVGKVMIVMDSSVKSRI